MKELISIVLALCLMLPCLAIADGAADGAYTAVCKGFYGDFNVTVTIAEGKIADIAWVGSMETAELVGAALEIMSKDMIEKNTSGVDSVSGATVTSAVFRMAVNDCLKQAGAPAEMSAAPAAAEKTAKTIDADVLVVDGLDEQPLGGVDGRGEHVGNGGLHR